MKNSLKTLALVVLLGLLFTGCGGESNSDVTPISSPGLVKNDAGMISCPVPSPTGDQPTKPGATSTARQKARYVYTSMNI